MVKMVIGVDIDSIFNAIENADWYREIYNKNDKKKPVGSDAFRKWRFDQDYYYKGMRIADEGVYGIIGALRMDQDAQRRMRIAYRAKRKWEKKTEYMYLVSNEMEEQFANFIFDVKDRYSCTNNGFVAEKRWWDLNNDVYERKTK